MIHSRVKELVEKLGLSPHPEGGYFKEVYRSEGIISKRELVGYSGSRNFATSIYFLLTKENFSAFHKIKQDELWHHYEGDVLEVHILEEEGTHKTLSLGKNISEGEQYQGMVKGGSIFGSKVKNGGEYALVGCTVAPGFDFDDFELCDRSDLLKKHPSHHQIVEELTR